MEVNNLNNYEYNENKESLIEYNKDIKISEDYKPILQWMGGKGRILNELMGYSPENFNNYYEPFFGGGAFLIKLYSMNKIKNAIISDLNNDLYNLYNIVKTNPDGIINEIKNIKFNHTREDYYLARDLFNETNNQILKSALLLYLNRHCFNGLYRVNSQNKFNVSYGTCGSTTLPSASDIKNLSKVFQKCKILNNDFEEVVKSAIKGDFIYFDPPYMQITKTSNFTNYTSDGFNETDQKRLFNLFKEMDKKGVYLMESNSDSPFIEELYKEFNIYKIDIKRNISVNESTRGTVKEIIITNYEINNNYNEYIKKNEKLKSFDISEWETMEE